MCCVHGFALYAHNRFANVNGFWHMITRFGH